MAVLQLGGSVAILAFWIWHPQIVVVVVQCGGLVDVVINIDVQYNIGVLVDEEEVAGRGEEVKDDDGINWYGMVNGDGESGWPCIYHIGHPARGRKYLFSTETGQSSWERRTDKRRNSWEG